MNGGEHEHSIADDGLIDFVPPDNADGLVIVKADDSTPVERPLPMFSDEQLPPFILGETDIRVPLTHLVMLQSAAIALLAQSQREILIVSPDLEHERFDNDHFIEALSAFARSSRYAVTRILIADPTLAIEDGHRLVKLRRKLSSLIDIRQVHENDVEHIEPLIIADDIGLLRCTSRDPWQGSLLPKGTPYAQQARERFIEWWNRGEEIADFRELRI